MFHTVKSLKYTALCFSLSLTAFAQWHEDVWDWSETGKAHARYVCTSNVFAAAQSFTLTNAVFARMTNVISGGVTNSVPWFTNSVSVQEFLIDISTATNTVGDVYTFSWPLNYATNQLTVDAALVAYTYSVTGLTARTEHALALDAAGVRDLDCYAALAERAAASSSVANPARFYRSHLANVVMFKNMMLDLIPRYLDTRIATGGTFNAYFSIQTNETAFPAWTNAEHLATVVSAPSNYFAKTWWRSVDATQGLARVVSCTNWISAAVTNSAQIVTNSTTATWGEPWALIGTNGQRFVRASTNEDIQAGATTGAYGQWRLRAAITNLQATTAAVVGATVLLRYKKSRSAGGEEPYDDWIGSKTSTETSWTGTDITTTINDSPTLSFFTWGQSIALFRRAYITAESGLVAVTNIPATNIACRVDVYGFPRAPDVFLPMYDGNGFLSEQPAGQRLQTIDATGGEAVSADYLFSASTLPTWCPDPQTAGGFAFYCAQGFICTVDAVLWWDFKYR